MDAPNSGSTSTVISSTSIISTRKSYILPEEKNEALPPSKLGQILPFSIDDYELLEGMLKIFDDKISGYLIKGNYQPIPESDINFFNKLVSKLNTKNLNYVLKDIIHLSARHVTGGFWHPQTDPRLFFATYYSEVTLNLNKKMINLTYLKLYFIHRLVKLPFYNDIKEIYNKINNYLTGKNDPSFQEITINWNYQKIPDVYILEISRLLQNDFDFTELFFDNQYINQYYLEIIDYLVQIYKLAQNANSEWHYFTWVNLNDPYYQAISKIPSADVFDKTALTGYDQYVKLTDALKTNKLDYWTNNFISDYRSCMGWTKKNILKAIEAMGYKSVKSTHSGANPNATFIYIPYIDLIPGYTGSKKFSVASYQPFGYKTEIDIYFYHSKSTLENIYRILAKPTKYLDWNKICKELLFPCHVLETIYANDFHRLIGNLKSQTEREICEQLSGLYKYDSLKDLIVDDMKEIYDEFMYRPGGPLMPKPIGYAPQLTQEFIRKEYREILNNCALYSEGKISAYQMMQVIKDYGLTDLFRKPITEYSPKDICKIIHNYIRLYQQT